MSEQIEEVFPCSTCNRNFIRSSLEKHELACKKLHNMHRKAFDSGKQRACGSDIPLHDVRKAQKEKEKYGGSFPRPKTKWRERHEEFIGAVSVSKQVKEPLKTNCTLSRATTNSDYIQCQYCKRTFNLHAAERHISFCKTKHEQNNFCSSLIKRTPSASSKKITTSQTNQSSNKHLIKRELSFNSKFDNLSIHKRDSSQSRNKTLIDSIKKNNNTKQNSTATCKTNTKN